MLSELRNYPFSLEDYVQWLQRNLPIGYLLLRCPCYANWITPQELFEAQESKARRVRPHLHFEATFV